MREKSESLAERGATHCSWMVFLRVTNDDGRGLHDAPERKSLPMEMRLRQEPMRLRQVGGSPQKERGFGR
jgi:hypothetical protein